MSKHEQQKQGELKQADEGVEFSHYEMDASFDHPDRGFIGVKRPGFRYYQPLAKRSAQLATLGYEICPDNRTSGYGSDHVVMRIRDERFARREARKEAKAAAQAASALSTDQLPNAQPMAGHGARIEQLSKKG